MNCHNLSITEVLEQPVDRDMFEFGFSQNLADNLGMPFNKYFTKDLLRLVREKYEGLDMLKNLETDFKARLTKDFLLLEKIDYSQIALPGVKTVKNFQKAQRYPHALMDKVDFKQSIFIEISEPGTDITVIPVTFELQFLAKLRKGPDYRMGHTQEFKAEYVNMKLEMQEC